MGNAEGRVEGAFQDPLLGRRVDVGLRLTVLPLRGRRRRWMSVGDEGGNGCTWPPLNHRDYVNTVGIKRDADCMIERAQRATVFMYLVQLQVLIR